MSNALNGKDWAWPHRLHFWAMRPSLTADNGPLGDTNRTLVPGTIYHDTYNRKAIENGATATAVGHMPQ